MYHGVLGKDMEDSNPESGLTPEMQVSERVHVMPLGYEEERAYLAAEKLKADKVVLVAHPDTDKYVSTVDTELTNRGIEVEVVRCDIFDLYSSLGMIAELIYEHRDEQVFVNISTGGKITAIAGMIACMVTGAESYYVQAEDYEMNIPKGIASIKSLPRYPIEAPDAQQIHVLDYIKERQEEGDLPTKGDLIRYGETAELPFIANHDVEDKGKYRLLDSHIIHPLEEKGYITIEKSGREKDIGLTKNGEGTLRAFRYMIMDEERENDEQARKVGRTQ